MMVAEREVVLLQRLGNLRISLLLLLALDDHLLLPFASCYELFHYFVLNVRHGPTATIFTHPSV